MFPLGELLPTGQALESATRYHLAVKCPALHPTFGIPPPQRGASPPSGLPCPEIQRSEGSESRGEWGNNDAESYEVGPVVREDPEAKGTPHDPGFVEERTAAHHAKHIRRFSNVLLTFPPKTQSQLPDVPAHLFASPGARSARKAPYRARPADPGLTGVRSLRLKLTPPTDTGGRPFPSPLSPTLPPKGDGPPSRSRSFPPRATFSSTNHNTHGLRAGSLRT